MSKSNHISECKFSGEMLAYLYGEIGEREKSVFEAHLSSCATCPDELADSAFARFSVQKWRDAEFVNLKTPVINIPYELKPEITAGIDASESLLARLRGFISLSPAWMTAGSAMAALAIGIGLIFAALNVFQPAEIAVNDNNKPVSVAISPTPEIIDAHSADIYLENTNIKPVSKQSPKSLNKYAEVTRNETPRESKIRFESKNAPIKVRESFRKEKVGNQFDAKVPANEQTASKKVIESAVSPTGRVPVLSSFDEEEDNTLRLAELFEDVDTEE